MRGGAISGLVLGALLGCCTSPPCREENLPPSRALATPEDAIHFFQYTIANECIERAYDTLTAYSREHISYTEFWFVIYSKMKIPGTDIPVADAIEYSRILAVERPPGPSRDPERAYVIIAYRNDLIVTIIVVKEPDGKWRIGLWETGEEGYFYMPGGME